MGMVLKRAINHTTVGSSNGKKKRFHLLNTFFSPTTNEEHRGHLNNVITTTYTNKNDAFVLISIHLGNLLFREE